MAVPQMNKSALIAVSCIVAAAMFFTSASWAWYELFSNFRPYDDEGFFMRANKMFLDGAPFYVSINWPYGPAYPAINDLVHGVLNVPLTTSWARILTLCTWLSLGTLSAYLLIKSRVSAGLSIAISGLVMLYMKSFVNEPGHPQGFIACATLLMPLILLRFQQGFRFTCWALIGLIAGGVAMIKVNAGVFAIGACLMVLAASVQLPGSRSRACLAIATTVAVSLAPFLLMASLLSSPNAFGYALISSIALVTVAAVLFEGSDPATSTWSATGGFIVGVVVMVICLTTYADLHGMPLGAIVGSLLSYRVAQLEFYHWFSDYSRLQLLGGVLSMVTASLFVLGRKQSYRSWLLYLGRLAFIAAVVYALIADSQGNAHAMIGWAGPWCWVCAARSETGLQTLPRRLLVALAVWFLLLAYPIPGSQLYFGSVLILPLFAMCLMDLARNQFRAEVIDAAGLLMAIVMVAVVAFSLFSARSHYQKLTPLGLPGTENLRLGKGEVRTYRNLVNALDKADVGLISGGFNSVYSWSSVKPPASVLFSHSFLFLNVDQVNQLKAGLSAASKPIVVMKKIRPGKSQPRLSEMERWIENNFHVGQRIGRYEVMKPKESGKLATPD